MVQCEGVFVGARSCGRLVWPVFRPEGWAPTGDSGCFRKEQDMGVGARTCGRLVLHTAQCPLVIAPYGIISTAPFWQYINQLLMHLPQQLFGIFPVDTGIGD